MPFDCRYKVYSRERGFDSMKKLFTMILSVALLATMVVGGTLATDGLITNPLTFLLRASDQQERTVLIDQTVEAGSLLDTVTKYQVSVSNLSTQDVYVRTLFAFEELDTWQHDDFFLLFTTNNAVNAQLQPIQESIIVDGESILQHVVITVDGRKYRLYEYCYPDAIAANTTVASLTQLQFHPAVTNAHLDKENYKIMILSQAIQATNDLETQNLKDANTLKQLFGAVTSNNHPWDTKTEWTGTIVD